MRLPIGNFIFNVISKKILPGILHSRICLAKPAQSLAPQPASSPGDVKVKTMGRGSAAEEAQGMWAKCEEHLSSLFSRTFLCPVCSAPPAGKTQMHSQGKHPLWANGRK